jgi:hypothetical protein
MKNVYKIHLIVMFLIIDVISIFFHLYMGKTINWIFWATSIIGTIAIICAAFPTIDLVVDRMYKINQNYD